MRSKADNLKMYYSHLFPFEHVKAKSKVIIYGFGEMGKSYYKQILETNYCELVGISDKNVIDGLTGDIYIYPENIAEREYDYVIIAIDNHGVASEVYHDLCRMGVPKKKIIHKCFRLGKEFTQKSDLGIENRSLIKDTSKLNIALLLHGGMGDIIVQESFYERLNAMYPNARYYIFCEKKFGDAVFYNKKNIACIRELHEACRTFDMDVVFRLRMCISVKKMNEDSLKIKAPELLEKIKALDIENGEIDFSENDFKDLVLIRRAFLKGMNRYSMLGEGDVFNLSSDIVNLEVDDRISNNLVDRGEVYITINIGADSKIIGTEKKQTKVLSIEKYNDLVKKLKVIFPDIMIVQLGTKDSVHIEGADVYLFGEELELVKKVIKHARLHIDCEGGLVHMASVLGTKCLVFFGPTPKFFYGYKNNINIGGHSCNWCMGVKSSWFEKCYISEQRCMESINIDEAIEAVKMFLE